MSVIEKFYEKERALEVLVVSLVCVDNILHLPEKDSIHNLLTNISVSLSENKSLGTRPNTNFNSINNSKFNLAFWSAEWGGRGVRGI